MSSKRVIGVLEWRFPTSASPAVRRRVVAGWVLSGLAVAFLLVDGVAKVLSTSASIETTVGLGYPAWLVPWVGALLLAYLVVYLMPRTAVLGAIRLTGYLGGAAATQVRLEDLWFVLPVVLGILLWVGLYVRDERLQQLVPLRQPLR